jgi:hypothetical protein
VRQALAATLILTALAAPAIAAQGSDPDWPCVQRKVPNLLPTQFWTGPALLSGGAADPAIADLAHDIAQRRLPLPEAQDKIRTFARSLAPTERAAQLTRLFAALFEQMNGERSRMLAGIARYARNQTGLAAAIRKESADIDALRAKASADASEIDRRSEALAVETRQFEERIQALTYVCEVPVLIEQRLYALTKTISEALKSP